MKVSKTWLKELVDLRVDYTELERLLPLRSIGIKEITEDFIELDMKGYNSSDLLSMRGVAQEVAAITCSPVTFTEDEPDLDEVFSDKKDLKVAILNSRLSPFYSLVKIENLSVGPSPKEWVKKLESSGIRSINNVADVTNLIMLEFGQPMHAFDAQKVSQETIVVRGAKEGEEIETLDGKKRILQSTDLLITDPEKALGIAGVMGGKHSEVSTQTKSILLEAAIFEPRNLRQTATRLGLISEAGKRFYHGLTKKRLYQALNAAVKMYEGLGGVVTAYFFEDNHIEKITPIELHKNQVDSLIGIEIHEKDIEEYLTNLNFRFQKQSSGIWLITPPYYRLDIEIQEDLIEEIVRMYGYEKIPAKELKGKIPDKVGQKLFKLIYSIKNSLAEAGLTEVQTYSFYSTEVLKSIGIDKNLLVEIVNPISSETQYMRFTLWENLLEVAAKNFKKGFDDIAIFEVGKTYQRKDGQPQEHYELTMLLLNKTDNPMQELNLLLQQSMKNINITIELSKTDNDLFEQKLFHPIRKQFITFKGEPIGGFTEIHPRILNKFGLNERVAVVELNLEKLL